MDARVEHRSVLQRRVAITTSDFERMLRFYADGLGVAPAAFWENAGGRAAMLDLGHATLEIFDEAQALAIDSIEVGRPVSGQFRFALEVADLEAATARLIANGARLVHAPVITPWGDHNARFEDPDGLQLTLFQVPQGLNQDSSSGD